MGCEGLRFPGFQVAHSAMQLMWVYENEREWLIRFQLPAPTYSPPSAPIESIHRLSPQQPHSLASDPSTGRFILKDTKKEPPNKIQSFLQQTCIWMLKTINNPRMLR